MKTNFHTHSLFCDGKNTIEENVLSAIEKKFDILGFSSHCAYPFSTDWHIPVKEISTYCTEVKAMQKKYSGKIEIRLGFEGDFISSITEPNFENYKDFNPDFIIGSVHFLTTKEKTFAIDESLDALKAGIEKYFGGDTKKAVQEYYSLQRQMLRKGGFSIIGHVDLITKYIEREKFFDEGESWYKKELEATADEIKKAGVIAEINTGAISRGYRTLPYPCEYMLSLLKERNVPITVNSDCHNADALDCGFEMAYEIARKVGYKETVCDINRDGFRFSSL